jgi:hypothetical protein
MIDRLRPITIRPWLGTVRRGPAHPVCSRDVAGGTEP